MSRVRRKSYTLIEIVTVIAIAAIIITLIGVSFENLGGSSNVDAATSEVGNALSLAQSQAASRRKYVAMIIADTKLASDIPKINGNAYSAYRLAYVEKPSSNSAKWIGWIPAQDWKLLPQGTAILSMADDVNDIKQTMTPADNYKSSALVEITDLPDPLPNAKWALVFSPKGVLFPTSEVNIIVTRGQLNDNGDVLDFQNAANAAEDSLMLKVNQYTGVISYETVP